MTSKSSKQPVDFSEIWNPFIQNSTNPLLFGTSIQARFIKAALEQQMEILDFLKSRLSKDAAIVDKLTKIHETPEMLSSLSGFMQEAIDDYSQETAKLASHGSRLAVDTANQMQRKTEEIANEFKSFASAA